MASVDVSYHALLHEILEKGYTYEDPNRKGVNRVEILSHTFKHEFKDGFPAISTKKLHYKNVVTELLWFLRGDTNIKYLVDNGCNIWNKDAYNYYKKFRISVGCKYYDYDKWLEYVKKGSKISEYIFGDLGSVYGKQWRNFNGVDQIQNLIKGLKEKPLGTEHIVNSWNASDISNMALPPCHYGFQIIIRPLTFWERVDLMYKPGAISTSGDLELVLEELDESNISNYGFELHFQMRSVDTFLGLPYNIASYATLALIIEKLTGYKALGIQGDLKKVHLYDNSLDAVKEQLNRDVNQYSKCEMTFHGEEGTTMFDHYKDPFRKDIDLNRLFNTFRPSTFRLYNYESYPAINVEMLERDE